MLGNYWRCIVVGLCMDAWISMEDAHWAIIGVRRRRGMTGNKMADVVIDSVDSRGHLVDLWRGNITLLPNQLYILT